MQVRTNGTKVVLPCATPVRDLLRQFRERFAQQLQAAENARFDQVRACACAFVHPCVRAHVRWIMTGVSANQFPGVGGGGGGGGALGCAQLLVLSLLWPAPCPSLLAGLEGDRAGVQRHHPRHLVSGGAHTPRHSLGAFRLGARTPAARVRFVASTFCVGF